MWCLLACVSRGKLQHRCGEGQVDCSPERARDSTSFGEFGVPVGVPWTGFSPPTGSHRFCAGERQPAMIQVLLQLQTRLAPQVSSARSHQRFGVRGSTRRIGSQISRLVCIVKGKGASAVVRFGDQLNDKKAHTIYSIAFFIISCGDDGGITDAGESSSKIDVAFAPSTCPAVTAPQLDASYYAGPLTDTHFHMPVLSGGPSPGPQFPELGVNTTVTEIDCTIRHEGTSKVFTFFSVPSDAPAQELGSW